MIKNCESFVNWPRPNWPLKALLIWWEYLKMDRICTLSLWKKSKFLVDFEICFRFATFCTFCKACFLEKWIDFFKMCQLTSLQDLQLRKNKKMILLSDLRSCLCKALKYQNLQYYFFNELYFMIMQKYVAMFATFEHFCMRHSENCFDQCLHMDICFFTCLVVKWSMKCQQLLEDLFFIALESIESLFHLFYLSHISKIV